MPHIKVTIAYNNTRGSQPIPSVENNRRKAIFKDEGCVLENNGITI